MDAESVERILRENGLTDRPDLYDGSIHSWRCGHPDRYGSCECFAELVADLTEEESPVLDDDQAEYLRKRLHSPEMQCEQCRLTRLLLDADAAEESR